MITTVELKRGIIDSYILDIIVGKLYYRQKPSLVILFPINKNLKVGFYDAILLLSLTVGLWLQSGIEPLLDA